MTNQAKASVRAFWEAESCGVRYATSTAPLARAIEIQEARDRLIPDLLEFADFDSYCKKDVLEIGTGAGTDFCRFVQAGANATGVDLTAEAVRNTAERLGLFGLKPAALHIADAENLPFPDNSFDLVYSWGVLHHSPDTDKAFAEAIRVLRPGGTIKAMIYHRRSWMALFYWIRFALLRGQPWRSVGQTISRYMESPGTKAYSKTEAQNLLVQAGASDVSVWSRLCQGDLFDFDIPERYNSRVMRVAQAILPRPLIRLCGHRWGGMLLIEARKPEGVRSS